MSIRMVAKLAAAAASLLALLTACGKSEQPAAHAASQITHAAAVAGSATLVVAPGSINGCKPTQHIVSTVSWHATVPSVKVLVGDAGQAHQKLFSEGGYSGKAKTGDWVVSGTTFVLTNASDGHVLASHTVGLTPCKHGDR